MIEAIDTLVGQFESRDLTRRQLVQALNALAVGSGTAAAAQAPFRAGSLNHASLAVSDVARSQAFYEELLGVREVSRQANGGQPRTREQFSRALSDRSAGPNASLLHRCR